MMGMAADGKKRWNIGIMAHVDAGKTTITEQLLLLGGRIRSAGSVDQGTAQTDYLEVERRRGISVKTACAEVSFGERIISLVDTPGHVDFAGEVARSLQVLDGAVLVVSGAEGVQAHTRTVFRALQKLEIPAVIVVNKIDRAGFDQKKIEEQIGKLLTPRYIPLQEVQNPACPECEILSWERLEEEVPGRPEREAGSRLGTTAPGGPESETGKQAGNPLAGRPDALAAEAGKRIRDRIFERLAEYDEELEEQFLLEEEPQEACLAAKLAQLTAGTAVYSLVFASAKEGKGIWQLAQAVMSFLPDASRKNKGFLEGVIFQISHDPAMGKAAHVRIFGGSLASRDPVPIAGKKPEEWEKATQIRKMQGGRFLDVGRIEAGEIAAVYGLTHCRIGDRILEQPASGAGKTAGNTGDMGEISREVPAGIAHEFPLETQRAAMEVTPLLLIQVSPEDPQKEMELAAALTQLAEEDPLLQYERNPLTRQMYLRVMGQVQIEVLQELLLTGFGLKINCSRPSVIYKETPGHLAVGQEVYTMPKPCWAIVELQIEPLPPGSGIQFVSVIKEKQLPYRYQHHVKISLLDTFRQGIYGWEVTDAKVTLVGGGYHHVHTHPLDFFVATPVAALRALTASESVLLEPYVKLELSAPEEWLGKVMGQILGMRGEISSPVIADGSFSLEAVVPLRDSLDYPITFRSLTSGRGSISREFHSYRPCEKGFVEILPRRGVDPLDRPKWILACRSALSRDA